jgi:hypothetical protein
MQLEKGTLLRVDEGERLTRPTSSVLLVAPLSDYEATPEFITKLKNGGQGILVLGLNGSGQEWIQVRRSRQWGRDAWPPRQHCRAPR